MNFFLEKLSGPFFYLRVYLPWGYTIPSLVWFEQLLDPIKRPIFKFLFREIQKVPYEILTFFLGKLYQKLFSFYILTTLVILHAKFGLIWTTPWPDEKNQLIKFLFREIQKVPYEILTFFLGKLYQKFFLFYFLITLVIPHAGFGLIWTTPWPDKISMF